MLDKKTLLQIKNFAVEEDWNHTFSGKSRGNRHLFRIVKLAKFLAQKTEADKQIVKAGAFLHDLPLVFGEDSDYKKNKEIVKETLKDFDLTKDEIKNIIECVASHEGTIKPKTLEAKIVHDADVLDKSGMLGIIRHTWKTANLSRIKESKVTDEDVQKIVNHILWRSKKIQTPIAREINQYLNSSLDKNDIKKIVRKTTKLAKQGIITEKIAVLLFKEFSSSERKKLKSQLDLSYLKRF